MQCLKKWWVDVTVISDDGYTAADARLFGETGERAVGTGHARVSADDADVPTIGAELAVARALRDLSTQLLDLTCADIEAVTDEVVHLAH